MDTVIDVDADNEYKRHAHFFTYNIHIHAYITHTTTLFTYMHTYIHACKHTNIHAQIHAYTTYIHCIHKYVARQNHKYNLSNRKPSHSKTTPKAQQSKTSSCTIIEILQIRIADKSQHNSYCQSPQRLPLSQF